VLALGACHLGMDPELRDRQVRLKAFEFLERSTSLHGEVLPWTVLVRGFDLAGQRVPLVSQQGIFKPAVLPEIPLSIRTSPTTVDKPRPYEDGFDERDLLVYRYRGTDPAHRENVGLRLALHRRAPLVYFFGVLEGQYLPHWPVYVVEDDPTDLCFRIALDEKRLIGTPAPLGGHAAEARRAYVTRVTLARLHQASFRERVLRAYQRCCAICRLKHAELLEAAHILPDSHPQGEPVVPNGIALCKLHHAAFDRHIVGVRPDLVIEVRRDILEEIDGPMLKHGLQEIAGIVLRVPRIEKDRPDRGFLEERYALFRKIG
jgi:putative restriction endonuclease